jgi:alpha-beta hydrolase superfamily lysophospholipase
LLFDLRDHGASDADGKGLTMGIKEHADVCAAYSFVTQTEGFKNVVFFGTSVGAASVILACARIVMSDKINHRIQGAVLENGLCDVGANAAGLVDTAVEVYKVRHWKSAALFRPVVWLAKLVAPPTAERHLRRRCAESVEVLSLTLMQHRYGIVHGKDFGEVAVSVAV